MTARGDGDESAPGRAALTDAERAFALGRRVARLATSDANGRPHIVPVCFACDGGQFFIALDEKPKRVAPSRLRRVRNIATNPNVSLLFDHYEDDWSRLGFVQVSGRAEIVAPGDPLHQLALPLLRERYMRYRAMDLESRPVIVVTPEHVTTWGTLAPLPTAATPAPGEWPGGVDFLALARGRRSVRAFQDQPVPRAVLEAMIEAAAWAPSPHGRQPWRFVVLTRAEPKRLLADAMGVEWQRTLEMDGEPAEIVALRLRKSRERIETAPAILLACLYLKDLDHYPDADRQRAEEIMATQSLGAAIQNALLCAYSLGLHTGWICAPLFVPETVRAALNLDDALIPHALIPVGYLAREPKRRTRRPLAELVARFD
ncbi:MAG TPA: TIGR03668 family PPOX class F420-dependent oxidoreductase [Ktedonobacterales bacterium]|nr:TIGR03668 family PPOX class F420-dependent oxidoreductase [Ktedonobacterales bacterium]